jgi:hypothetical protein
MSTIKYSECIRKQCSFYLPARKQGLKSFSYSYLYRCCLCCLGKLSSAQAGKTPTTILHFLPLSPLLLLLVRSTVWGTGSKCTAVTWGVPLVRVPVLSNTTVRTWKACSRAAAPEWVFESAWLKLWSSGFQHAQHTAPHAIYTSIGLYPSPSSLCFQVPMHVHTNMRHTHKHTRAAKKLPSW